MNLIMWNYERGKKSRVGSTVNYYRSRFFGDFSPVELFQIVWVEMEKWVYCFEIYCVCLRRRGFVRGKYEIKSTLVRIVCVWVSANCWAMKLILNGVFDFHELGFPCGILNFIVADSACKWFTVNIHNLSSAAKCNLSDWHWRMVIEKFSKWLEIPILRGLLIGCRF